MDLFVNSRREMKLDLEISERRRRLYDKFKKGKQKTLTENTWSVEDHRDYLMVGYSDAQLRFGIIPRRMLCFPAFWELSGLETKVLLMACNETGWTKPVGKVIKGRKYKTPRQPMPFILPLARLEAVGISRRSAIRALEVLQRLGFLEEIASETGKPTAYCLSDRFMDICSSEIGDAKMTPPVQREKPVSGDTHIGKVNRIAS